MAIIYSTGQWKSLKNIVITSLMNGTVLSDDIVAMVGELAELQHQKADHQERIQLYENKLNMAREATLGLTQTEQELVGKLQQRGFFYGQSNVSNTAPAVPVAPTSNNISPTSLPQDQLAALLNTLFQQQAPTSQAPTSQITAQPINHAPTSTGSFQLPNSTPVYNFPQPVNVELPPKNNASRVSPTSAPGLSIRKSRNNND